MSLLIDALREAEQRKAMEEGARSPLGNDDPQAGGGQPEHDPPPVGAAVPETDGLADENILRSEEPAAETELPVGGLSLDEVSEEAPGCSTIGQIEPSPPVLSQAPAEAPETPLGLEIADESARPQEVTPPDDGAGADDTMGPVQADNLFQAKEGAWKSPRRRFLLFAAAGFLVTAAVIAVYYYWHLQQIRPVIPPPLAQAPSPAVVAGAVSPPRDHAPAVTPASDSASTAGKAAASPVPASDRSRTGKSRHIARKAAVPTRRQAAKPPIRIRRTARPPVFPLLQQAYAAFGEGRLDESRRLYAQVRRMEPGNRDALLGLAAVALRSGRLEEARSLYRRCLEIEPKDTVARAGLLSLLPAVDPATREADLKSLLEEAGDSAPVHFALGNLYAQQQRWVAAQAAYFRALRAAPGNADYAYNLAVSLEHLGRRREALDFYRRALRDGGRPVSFDRGQATARVRTLHAMLKEAGT